jgi:hypothetical protein
MKRVRHLIRNRPSGGALAVLVAYALAIQALLASVGLGMSAAATSGQSGFVICAFSPWSGARTPATPNDRQAPDPQPECPFCFVAAQSAGAVAALGAAPVFPAYAGLPLAGSLDGDRDDGTFVPLFHRTAGGPRAPPRFSV